MTDGNVVLACGGSVRLYVRAPALALLDARYRFDAPVTYIAGRADDTFHESSLPSAELSRATLVLRFGRARDHGRRFPLHYPGGWRKEPG